MSDSRLPQYLDEMRRAADNARDFVSGMSLDAFRLDKRTQQAVAMSIIIIGEAATQIMDRYQAFTEAHSDWHWLAMRGMRNRIAHSYFTIDMKIVWTTVQTEIPEILSQLNAISE
ncbi:HepT-like ribonuclease domain-containing protein [Acidisoma silvae]|uniref:DUF86 domain-containing protein n=1 Tax=Acidisoma silvae TaxID=2802396 RepID=A0A963YTY5_9PROT|nr:DUF86 domain-containing protein [Acidisoma silvae]MCB8876395.1 DUF86 domain-containing protein [Acidisoma silvae]